ncbi:hypothetical protein GCM10027446_15370 [Angustibacter peucedani]
MTWVRRRWDAVRCSDGGSAVVEFVVLGVLLLVPVVYLVLALGRLQAGALAAEGAAREAGRAFVTADDSTAAHRRAEQAAAVAFADQGFGADDVRSVALSCGPGDCLAPDQRVVVRSRLLVVLPGVPRFLARVVPTRVEVTASHVATVDRFRARP